MKLRLPLSLLLLLAPVAGCWEVVPYKGETSTAPASTEDADAPSAGADVSDEALFGEPADASRPAPAAEIVAPPADE